jgi:hypothetical protein
MVKIWILILGLIKKKEEGQVPTPNIGFRVFGGGGCWISVVLTVFTYAPKFSSSQCAYHLLCLWLPQGAWIVMTYSNSLPTCPKFWNLLCEKFERNSQAY